MSGPRRRFVTLPPVVFVIESNFMSQIPENLRYTTTHEWLKCETPDAVLVGITDHAQSELGDLVYVQLPEVGRRVQAGAPCVVLESVKTAADSFSPVSGEIVAVNTALSDHPEHINQAPYEAWLFRIKPDNPSDLDALLDAAGYAALLAATE